MEALVSVCRELRQEDTIGIGVGCPGPLDPREGTVFRADNLPDWNGNNVLRPLEALGLPVALENDADAALVGEVFFGAGDREQPTVMLTFGTGIGSSFWTGSGIFRGAYNEHPEFGHMPIFQDGPPCYCGMAGCLESLASGQALARLAAAEGFLDNRDFIARGDLTLLRKVIDTALWTIATTFRPATVILGGGIMEEHFDRLAPWSILEPEDAPMLLAPMKVVPAGLGNRAGIVGAAALVELR